MKTVKLEIELTYDDELMHGDDPEAIEWFNRIVFGPGADLTLYENSEIGDDVGTVKALRMIL